MTGVAIILALFAAFVRKIHKKRVRFVVVESRGKK